MAAREADAKKIERGGGRPGTGSRLAAVRARLNELDSGLAAGEHVRIPAGPGGDSAHAVRSCVKSGGVRRLCHDAVLRVQFDMLKSAGFEDVQMEDRWWDEGEGG